MAVGAFKEEPSVLTCPFCGSKGQKQPVMVILELVSYIPWVLRPGPGDDQDGYSDLKDKPQYRYKCPRKSCAYSEIWTSQPKEYRPAD